MSWFNEWALWYLGLGKYKGHRRQRNLRPPAPKRIPLRAWVLLRTRISPLKAEVRLRARTVSYWLWGIAHEPQIHYRQFRKMEWLKTPWRLKSLPRYADCSEFVTDGIVWAGGKDPNRQGNSGIGNTNTMYAVLPHIPLKEVKAGDIGIFGTYPNTTHAIGFLEDGTEKNPWVMSHGQERGPIKIRLSEEKDYHKGEKLTCLRSI